MQCTECGIYASPTAKFCEECGSDVKIDESIIKECPECSKRLKLTAKFCTGCRFSFENGAKKIICEGKREDDTKCDRELSPCGTRLRKEDDHEGGNDKNQPDEINIDQTEAKNKNQPDEINIDQTEAKNKNQPDEINIDQTEAKNKNQPDEINIDQTEAKNKNQPDEINIDQTEANNKDQTDEINIDQTEAKNKNQPDEINKDQTEANNKDQTEANNKVDTEELDGRDDEDRPEQKTEKQIIETIENTTQKSTFNHQLSAETKKRGLAVVCSHSKFIHKTHNLTSRDSAFDDHAMMTSLWDLYGCHVIDFTDKGSNFYNTELIEKIRNELEKIENFEIFVFVLSSHGEEKEEKLLKTDEQGSFQHYFFTKDGQWSTQDLMNEIANIEKLENKLKIFIIQACRSRTVAKDENEDHGVEFEIESEKSSDLSGGQNDGTVHPDAKPDDKRQNDGIDLPDARGYMPPEDEDEDEEVIQQPNVASGRTEAHGEMENEIENSSSEIIIDLPPVEGVPHCDDCVVMFASMSGKYAYSRSNSLTDSGGWLINSVDRILKKYEKGDSVHILDLLVEINREVGTRVSEVEREMCEINPNLDFEKLQPGLKNHIDRLREICSKHSSRDEINKCQVELDKLAEKIDQIELTEGSLNTIKDETVLLTKKLKQELKCVVMLKAQSSFFHNLAFDDKDLFLCKMK